MMNVLKLSLAKIQLKNNWNNALVIQTILRSLSTSSKLNISHSLNRYKKTESSSFVMNIFRGKAKVSQQFPYPQVLSSEDIQTIDMVTDPLVKSWREGNLALENDLNEKFDDNLWEALKQMGAFGIQVPTELGGIGFNNTQYARMAEIMGTYDLSIGIALGAHQSIGFKGILLYGTDKQKQKYLPDLASGRKIACFCLTEPSAGSDASGIKTKAQLSADGKDYILNGSKIWISNGGIAHVFTVFAKTPIKSEDGDIVEKITAFIVERVEGLTSGPPCKKMGIKASNTTEVFFDNVKVPVENVLGEVGKGFKVAMHILNNGRFGMAGGLSGTMRAAIAKASEHATTRTQFGNKISTYGTIQEKIARMSISHYVTESMAYMLSGIMDKGCPEYQLEAAISKIYASEAAWFVVDEAIQILGGMGYMRETGLEKVLRDVRIFRIFEGTNDILRNFIALTGIQHAGRHLRGLQKAINNPFANLGTIFSEGVIRMQRSVGLSSGPSISEFVDPQLRNNAALVSKAIQHFGASVEFLLLKYNKKIINEQMLLKRLADAAIDIYSMVVVLSRVSRALNKNISSAGIEMKMCHVICSEAFARITNNLNGLKANEVLKNNGSMKLIAEEVMSNGGVVQNTPLD